MKILDNIKNEIYLILLLLSVTSCSVTKNWQSTQENNFWKANYQSFTGKEKLVIPAAKEKVLYLGYQINNQRGVFNLNINGENHNFQNNRISYQKINLNKKLKIEFKGKKSQGNFYLSYPTYINKKIKVQINKNIELLALSYLLINYDDYTSIPKENVFKINGINVKQKDLLALNTKIVNEFLKFKNSKNLKILKTYFNKDFFLHYTNFILSLDDFPNAKLNPPSEEYLNKFSGKQDATKFISAMNNLCNEIHFDSFLVKYKPYYDEMISEVSNNIPNDNFILEMEHLYKKQIENYTLFPSLTLSFSMGFAVGLKNGIGYTFAAIDRPLSINNKENLNLGYADKSELRNISVHEFGHSFVNPAIDNVDNKLIKSKEYLFETIKDKMTSQSYNSWKICLYEHFVRTGEVMIAKLLNDNVTANNLLNDYVKNRQFIYLPFILKKMEYWYYNEYFDKSYDQFVKETIAELKK